MKSYFSNSNVSPCVLREHQNNYDFIEDKVWMLLYNVTSFFSFYIVAQSSHLLTASLPSGLLVPFPLLKLWLLTMKNCSSHTTPFLLCPSFHTHYISSKQNSHKIIQNSFIVLFSFLRQGLALCSWLAWNSLFPPG